LYIKNHGGLGVSSHKYHPTTSQQLDKIVGLISLLLDVALSQDVPFCRLQQLHSKLHGATFVLLCVPVLCNKGVNLQ